MDKLSCVVIEDEEEIREWIISKLANYSEIDIIGESDNLDEAFSTITTKKPDVAFMDIKLIGGDVFTLLERLRNNNLPVPLIVLTTGFPEFALTAINDYRQYIVHYIVKPYAENWQSKFRNAIDALIVAKQKQTPSKELKELIKESNQDFTYIQTKGSLIKIEFDNLAYLEAGGGGESILVMDDEIHQVNLTMTKFMQLLPTNFIKVSKSNIVNMERIISINKSERSLLIDSKPKPKQIGISDIYYSQLLENIPQAKKQTK